MSASTAKWCINALLGRRAYARALVQAVMEAVLADLARLVGADGWLLPRSSLPQCANFSPSCQALNAKRSIVASGEPPAIPLPLSPTPIDLCLPSCVRSKRSSIVKLCAQPAGCLQVVNKLHSQPRQVDFMFRALQIRRRKVY